MLWVYLYCLAIVFANVLAKSTSCLFYQHFLSGALFFPAAELANASDQSGQRPANASVSTYVFKNIRW